MSKLINGEKFARKCSATGEGMNEGWFINGKYYKYIEDANKHAKTIPNEENYKSGNYKDFNELYNSFDEDEPNDFCYFTDWSDET